MPKITRYELPATGERFDRKREADDAAAKVRADRLKGWQKDERDARAAHDDAVAAARRAKIPAGRLPDYTPPALPRLDDLEPRRVQEIRLFDLVNLATGEREIAGLESEQDARAEIDALPQRMRTDGGRAGVEPGSFVAGHEWEVRERLVEIDQDQEG